MSNLAKLLSDLVGPVYSYFCKKTGDTSDIEIVKLPEPAIFYCFLKGLGEYLDNYHASETLKTAKVPNGKHATEALRAEAVRPLVVEAIKRLLEGDVPKLGTGYRITDNSAAAQLAKGKTLTPEEIMAVIAEAEAKKLAEAKKNNKPGK